MVGDIEHQMLLLESLLGNFITVMGGVRVRGVA
jgi:hypothetical protein